jgi:hypothetical protein
LIGIGPMPAGGTTAGRRDRARLTERHVLALGLGVSALFVAAAVVSAATIVVVGAAPWTAIHLAMAGAATVAIGTFMPHFAVTLAGTRPRPAAERLTALALLAGGAAAVVTGVAALGGWLAGIGTLAMLAGLGIVAVEVFAPLRDPLARRHRVVGLAYGAALGMLAAGIIIGGLGAVGLPAVLSAWAELRPAHVWLSLFGAVSLTIFATLVYLAPTVLGARIRPTRSLFVGVAGMLLGAPVAAVGFGLGAAPIVVAGIVVALLGAFGQLGYLADVVRRRGPYTTEHDWRRVSWVHLVVGPAWYAAALLAALGGIVTGDPVRGWSIGLLAVPMVAGWMLQELIGSWTHLVPSVTPGTAADHARQRRLLAVASRSRLVAFNIGVGLLWGGAWLDITPLLAAGALLLGATVLLSLSLLVRALAAGRY